MPNNLVFNNVAQQLKTKLYGDNSGTTTAIATNSEGHLLVEVGTIDTISEVVNVSSVDTVDTVSLVSEVANISSVDTVDTVSLVSEVANVSSVDTVDTVSLVSEVANVSSVDAVDTVDTVSKVLIVDTVANTVNIEVVGNDFAESVVTINDYDFGTATTVLTMDTSDKELYSFYVKHTGGETVDAKIQISPTSTDEDFTDDVSSTYSVDTDDSIAVLIPGKYLKYTRLYLSGSGSGSVVAYYNGHN